MAMDRLLDRLWKCENAVACVGRHLWPKATPAWCKQCGGMLGAMEVRAMRWRVTCTFEIRSI
eukprot:973542-Alexandrium_andersonii.AAC.1